MLSEVHGTGHCGGRVGSAGGSCAMPTIWSPWWWKDSFRQTILDQILDNGTLSVWSGCDWCTLSSHFKAGSNHFCLFLDLRWHCKGNPRRPSAFLLG